jgi:hypothetical protein
VANHKKQFCPKGHDTFVCGRNKKNQCIECKKHPAPVSFLANPICAKGHDKRLTGFYKDGKCKVCVLKRCKERHEKHKQEINAKRRSTGKQYRLEHPLTLRQKERKKITFQQWANNNRSSINSRNIKAATNRSLRVVAWTDWDKILNVYKNCPEDKEVDHTIPLQGEFVSGLHVDWNLQYLTPHENRSKLNQINLLDASNWYGKILEEAGLK